MTGLDYLLAIGYLLGGVVVALLIAWIERIPPREMLWALSLPFAGASLALAAKFLTTV
jgi:hypothetical protein